MPCRHPSLTRPRCRGPDAFSLPPPFPRSAQEANPKRVANGPPLPPASCPSRPPRSRRTPPAAAELAPSPSLPPTAPRHRPPRASARGGSLLPPGRDARASFGCVRVVGGGGVRLTHNTPTRGAAADTPLLRVLRLPRRAEQPRNLGDTNSTRLCLDGDFDDARRRGSAPTTPTGTRSRSCFGKCRRPGGSSANTKCLVSSAPPPPSSAVSFSFPPSTPPTPSWSRSFCEVASQCVSWCASALTVPDAVPAALPRLLLSLASPLHSFPPPNVASPSALGPCTARESSFLNAVTRAHPLPQLPFAATPTNVVPPLPHSDASIKFRDRQTLRDSQATPWASIPLQFPLLRGLARCLFAP